MKSEEGRHISPQQQPAAADGMTSPRLKEE